MTTVPNDRKPSKKPARSIRVLEQPTPDTDGWAAIEIKVGKESAVYLIHPVESQLASGATGFEVEKLDANLAADERYHVHLTQEPANCSCECKGFLRWSHCKHIDGLSVLTTTGRIPKVKPVAPITREEEEDQFASALPSRACVEV